MEIFIAIIFLAEGYLLGSIPSAVWIGILLFAKDVRQYGSGNAGATNTFRVLGTLPGIMVLASDILKGFLAVKIPIWLNVPSPVPLTPYDFSLLCGLAAVVGHLYPVFADFRGGKGVATALGIILASSPLASGFTVLFFILVWLGSGYVSLASISSGLFFTLVYFAFFRKDSMLQDVITITLPILLFYTHRTNIKKLWQGKENKTLPFSKK